jgi:predicted metal-dependent phosphoesterase TrpH
MRIDLHTHTTASDGTLTPAGLVQAALRDGIDVLAITDHDTVAGIAPALEAADGTSLCVLAGVELAATHGRHGLHLLAYGIDPADRTLTARLHDLASLREERVRDMLELLRGLGVAIQWEQVATLARGTVGRPHVAQALVEAGYARDTNDAFARYIGNGSPAYLPSARLTVAEAVALARDAGGAVALAHPMLSLSRRELVALLPALRHAGLTGLEVYHSEHDAAATRYLRELAAEQRLWWTGGSDFHGGAKPQVRLGGVAVPAEVLAQGPFQRAMSA